MAVRPHFTRFSPGTGLASGVAPRPLQEREGRIVSPYMRAALKLLLVPLAACSASQKLPPPEDLSEDDQRCVAAGCQNMSFTEYMRHEQIRQEVRRLRPPPPEVFNQAAASAGVPLRWKDDKNHDGYVDTDEIERADDKTVNRYLSAVPISEDGSGTYEYFNDAFLADYRRVLERAKLMSGEGP
jgi:hypothetical protein